MVLQKENAAEYDKFISQLRILKTECPKIKDSSDSTVKSVCDKYDGLFDLVI